MWDGKSHNKTFTENNEIEEDKNELKEKGRRMARKFANWYHIFTNRALDSVKYIWVRKVDLLFLATCTVNILATKVKTGLGYRPKDIFNSSIKSLLAENICFDLIEVFLLIKIGKKCNFEGIKFAGRGAGCTSTFPSSSAAHRSAGNSPRKMQNFKTFRTNFTPKTGLIDVGRLGLQFSIVIRGTEWRIDSPFWDFGITVTCLSRAGVDWLGCWAMLVVLLCAETPPSSASQRLQPIWIFLRLRNTVAAAKRDRACATTSPPPTSPSTN